MHGRFELPSPKVACDMVLSFSFTQCRANMCLSLLVTTVNRYINILCTANSARITVNTSNQHKSHNCCVGVQTTVHLRRIFFHRLDLQAGQPANKLPFGYAQLLRQKRHRHSRSISAVENRLTRSQSTVLKTTETTRDIYSNEKMIFNC